MAGKPWINFEWLSDLPFYFAFTRFGARGVFVLMMALSEAITLGVFVLAYWRSRDVKAAFLASWITAMLATVSLAPRTLLFGWLLLVVELGVMELYRRGRDYTWAMPLRVRPLDQRAWLMADRLRALGRVGSRWVRLRAVGRC